MQSEAPVSFARPLTPTPYLFAICQIRRREAAWSTDNPWVLATAGERLEAVALRRECASHFHRAVNPYGTVDAYHPRADKQIRRVATRRSHTQPGCVSGAASTNRLQPSRPAIAAELLAHPVVDHRFLEAQRVAVGEPRAAH